MDKRLNVWYEDDRFMRYILPRIEDFMIYTYDKMGEKWITPEIVHTEKRDHIDIIFQCMEISKNKIDIGAFTNLVHATYKIPSQVILNNLDLWDSRYFSDFNGMIFPIDHIFRVYLLFFEFMNDTDGQKKTEKFYFRNIPDEAQHSHTRIFYFENCCFETEPRTIAYPNLTKMLVFETKSLIFADVFTNMIVSG